MHNLLIRQEGVPRRTGRKHILASCYFQATFKPRRSFPKAFARATAAGDMHVALSVRQRCHWSLHIETSWQATPTSSTQVHLASLIKERYKLIHAGNIHEWSLLFNNLCHRCEENRLVASGRRPC